MAHKFPEPTAHKQGAPRAKRRVVEDKPHPDYIERLVKAGPRKGESALSFHKRIGAISVARDMIIKAWRKYRGDRTLVAETLGINRGNLYHEMRRAGLSGDLLDRIYVKVRTPKAVKAKARTTKRATTRKRKINKPKRKASVRRKKR